MAIAPFSVMVKPVGSLCNLECDYCYYSGTAINRKNSGNGMSDRLLETLIRQYIEASPGPVVSFTWHGGEPTLAGLDFYRLAVQLQKKYLPQGWSCWNNLQTNALLLDDEWCSFLAENHFDVGVSMDGTKWLHDEHRKDLGGNGTYERVAETVRRLQAHGIQPDLLCTVTSSLAKEPAAVYHALKDLYTGWLQFIPIVRRTSDGQVTPDSVSGSDYGDFLCNIFDEWVYHDLGRLDIQLFAEMSLVLAGGAPGLCFMAPTCGRVIIVEQDGSVYSCDHFVTPECRIGDIGTMQIGALIDAPQQCEFGNRKRSSLPKQCRSCQWLSFCNGGCPKDRFTNVANDDAGLNYLCEGIQKICAHVEPTLSRIHQLRASGFTQDTIMNKLQTEAKAKWHGIGRNDLCPCGSGRKAKHCCWK